MSRSNSLSLIQIHICLSSFIWYILISWLLVFCLLSSDLCLLSSVLVLRLHMSFFKAVRLRMTQTEKRVGLARYSRKDQAKPSTDT